MRTISAWIYGVPEEDVRTEVRTTEARITERRRRRDKSVDDSVAQLSDELRSLREGRE